MTEDVIRELNREGEPSEFHQSLLEYALRLVNKSRCDMAKYYDQWDLAEQVYRGERVLDNEDVKAEMRGKPVKMIVPNTFAQVQTFTSFLFLMFNQNTTFFELNPTGDEDALTKRRDCEQVLARDLRKNMWNTTLYQHLTHVGVYGPAILDVEWTRKVAKLKVNSPATTVNFQGQQLEVRSGSEWRDFVKYEGNLITPISPYSFFPDTNFPLVDFRKGKFVATETEYTMEELRDLASVGHVAGIDNIQPLRNDWFKERGGITRTISAFKSTNNGIQCGHKGSEGPVLVTKKKCWIVPSKYKFGSPEKRLGPEEFPVLYHLWYANDQTIIRLEPAEEWHNSFGTVCSLFTPDMHQTLQSQSLAGLIYRLQDVISWFINSHVKEVNRTIQNRRVINPELVEGKTLDSEGDIYLKKGFGRRSVQEALMQLAVTDVTGGHMSDAQIIQTIMQMVTGVNDNAMGQYNGGRRSAQEARVVTAGAAGRMKLHGHLIWEMSLGPLGQMMLSNSRQSLSAESFNRIIGSAAVADPSRYGAFVGTPEEVICNEDFMIFDSTLASEKGFMAQSLQELLSAIISANPMIAQQLAMQINPRKLIDEIQFLRGGAPTSRFAYAPGELPQMPQPALVPQAPAVA